MASYFEPDPAWLRLGSTGAPIVLPDLANGTFIVSAAGAWTYGAWVQIDAGANVPANAILVSIEHNTDGNNGNYQLQLGQGAIGLEVVIGTWALSVLGDGSMFAPVIPFITLQGGVRLAGRIAAQAGGAIGPTIKVGIAPQPS